MTNVIESSFATVRHRTVRSKGCLSNKTALAMIFKLAESAEKSWRRLDGHNQLPKVILGVKFSDGIEVVRSQAQAAPPDPYRHQEFGDSSASSWLARDTSQVISRNFAGKCSLCFRGTAVS